SRLTRFRNLYKTSMVSDSVLDEARQQASERSIVLEEHLARLKDFPNQIAQQEASVEESKARLDRALLDLAQTEVRAPFDGRVIKTFVAPGDRALPGNPLLQVADYNGLEVRVSVPSNVGHTLRQRLHQGNPIEASGTVNGQEFDFVLDRLSGDVKAGQSGLDAFFKPVSDEPLDIGRVVNLEISLPVEENVIALPVQSIYENNRVYRVEDNRLVGLNVEQVGDYIDDKGNFKVLVRSPGIHEGDTLVTTQLPRAISGLLVDPIDSSKFDEALANERG
ncbi:MAG: HlyD family efflux transporter periplasmic adaptor subunit, partial [Pseudomonadales bacterium]|nr:HlyD family efflux transporter periplasmic adaptor subunit [Pseudomonadales bacterium]